jgi:serine/threonine protein kinase
MSKTRKELRDISPFDPEPKEQMPQSGDHLGHCRIIELIAAGGMANVYKVWHEQLEVVRAIKILKPGFDDESKSRLETEAKISANLRHNNIVEIYGMGFWHDIPYIEMEYVDGPSLKEILEKNGRLPLDFSIAVTHSLCTALHFAHTQDLTLYGKVYDSLIHRDIKPANILITNKGVVKLADFGIARPSETSLHTVNGKVMGTFAYLSPEQLNADNLDQRSDIYSLGTVLYEMLTGQKTYPQKMLTELIHRKSRGQYIPAGSLCKDIPKQVNAIVDKSLAIDKNKRFQDAADLDSDLISIVKKSTMRQFEELIRNYIANPIPVALKQQRTRRHQSVAFAAYILLFIITAAGGVYIVDKYWDTIVSLTMPFRKASQVSQAKQSVPIDKTATKAETLPGTAPRAPSRSPGQPKKSAVIRSAPQPSSSESLTKQVSGSTERAVALFRSGDYVASITLITEMLETPLNVTDRDQLTTYLLWAHIKNNDTQKALSIADSDECRDGYFYFLAGELQYNRSILEKAENNFKKARSLPSHFDKSIPKKSSLYLAKIRDGLYMMKPNVDNKQLCVRAWSTFIDMYCTGDDSQECTDANERLNSLVAKTQ